MKLLGLLFIGLLLGAEAGAADADFRAEREALIKEIEQDVKATGRHLGRERLDPRVLQALRSVPRHRFVAKAYRDEAYENRPLPIGYGQTISQPYIVAIMTELLEPEPGQRMLELGTGSGYQAAVLAQVTGRVYSMEIIPELGEQAAQRLRSLGYDNVQVRVGDGYHGWPEQGPFDGIIVTAAGDHVPPPLVEQLKPGGRMVIPVGSWYFTQQLLLIEKAADGTLETREILPVAFVPLTGDH
jgi:protein-L-isoaspartate(D-aspartate) O-methyltransferase